MDGFNCDTVVRNITLSCVDKVTKIRIDFSPQDRTELLGTRWQGAFGRSEGRIPSTTLLWGLLMILMMRMIMVLMAITLSVYHLYCVIRFPSRGTTGPWSRFHCVHCLSSIPPTNTANMVRWAGNQNSNRKVWISVYVAFSIGCFPGQVCVQTISKGMLLHQLFTMTLIQ